MSTLTVASMLSAHLPGTTEVHPCPTPGCTVFPFETKADLDAHLVKGDHVVPTVSGKFEVVSNGFGGTTTRRAESPAGRQFRRPNQVRPATPGQISYLRDLVAKKTPDVTEEFTQSVIDAGFDRVSKAIDTLKAKPDHVHATVEAAPVAAKVRVNRYAGQCEECGKQVAAEAGRLSKDDEGKWQVWHLDGECPVTEFPFPYSGYALRVGDEVKFYVANQDGIWAKASNDLWPLGAGQAAVIEAIAADAKGAAALYGQELGCCGRCGRDLTSEWRKAGIGPVCSQKGW